MEAPGSKRQHRDGHSHRKKKRRIDVKMEYVQPSGGRTGPFVGYFPTGFDPATATMADGTGEDVPPLTELVAFQNSQKFKQRQHQLVARANGSVDFVGTNYTGEAAIWHPCSYALGVFNKDEGTLKLVPIAGEKVLRMEPRVKGVLYGHTDADEVNEADMTPELRKLQMERLTHTLGSQRSKLKTERRARGLIKESALGEFTAEMESVIHSAGLNAELVTREEALAKANAEIVRNIPPHNLAATSVVNAYPVDELISLEEWDSLETKELKKAAAKPAKEEVLRKQNDYPNFVLNRLRRLRVQGDVDGNDRRAHLLMYIKHLLSFFSAPRHLFSRRGGRGDLGDVEGALHIPSAIVAKFFKLFTDTDAVKGGSSQSKEQKNLLISYILVLGLTVDDFVSDPHDLAVELKMTVNQLKPYYVELGCKMEQQKAADRAGVPVDPNSGRGRFRVTLPIPLTFPLLAPKLKRGRGR